MAASRAACKTCWCSMHDFVYILRARFVLEAVCFAWYTIDALEVYRVLIILNSDNRLHVLCSQAHFCTCEFLLVMYRLAAGTLTGNMLQSVQLFCIHRDNSELKDIAANIWLCRFACFHFQSQQDENLRVKLRRA